MRRANSPHAGRISKAGSKMSWAAPTFSMNEAHSSRGVMPLARPAADEAARRDAHIAVAIGEVEAG